MTYSSKGSSSLSYLLVATLCSGKNVKIFRSIIREREFKRYKKESVQVALSRLNKKSYLKNSKTEWSPTQKGKMYFKKVQLFSYISSPFKKNIQAEKIISFDIPESQRHIRNWLRNQLKIFDYQMLQQSLWLGPGPLPKEFLIRLEDLEIRKNVKIFSITKKIN